MIKKFFRFSFSFLLLFLIYGCGESALKMIEPPPVLFNSPFPKRAINFTRLFEKPVTLLCGEDTLTLRATFNPDNNLTSFINNISGDTINQCFISRYRGLYYCSEPFNDTTWLVYPIRVTDHSITGLFTGYTQMFYLQQYLMRGKAQANVLSKNGPPDDLQYLLKTDKSSLKKIYPAILDSLPACRIIGNKKQFKADLKEELQDASEEKLADTSSGISFTISPNPANSICTITYDMESEGLFEMTITNSQGKSVFQDASHISTGTTSQLMLSRYEAGTYFISIRSLPSGKPLTKRLVIVH